MEYLEFENIAHNLAEYLHARGVCQNPLDIQQVDSVHPAVFIEELPDTPDYAVMVAQVEDDRGDDDNHPEISVIVVCRSDNFNQTQLLANDIFNLLHDVRHVQLTANVKILLSRRVIRSRMARDKNSRYVRVDTYILRPEQ